MSISDIVDLIIDKKVKELEKLKDEKDSLIIKIKEEENKIFSDFSKKLIQDNFEEIKDGKFKRVFDNYDSPFGTYDEDYIFLTKSFIRMGFYPKGYVNRTDVIYDERNEIIKQISDVQNSKDKLIAEVTLQHLSSIDTEFGDNIEKLTERIFNNNSNKHLN